MRTARREALHILSRVESGGYSGLTIDAELRKSGLDTENRAFATALVYSVLENRLTADYVISRNSNIPLEKIEPHVLGILRLGVCQIYFLGGVEDYAAVNETVELALGQGVKGFVNGVLRSVCREKERGVPPYPDRETDEDAYLAARYSCPKELIRKWRAEYGDAALSEILPPLLERKRHDARVNTLIKSRSELLNIPGVQAVPHPLLENAVVFQKLPELQSSDAWRDGLFHLQGAASQLCCEALDAKPGDTVIDLCAAPGGKSFTIAEMMRNSGRILACELHKNRLSLITEGAGRLGIEIIEPLQNDATKPGPTLGEADRVLCDVPCSGLGVIRSKPEIRYRPLEMFERLPEIQYKILSEGASHVKPGGLLVYSTCTLSRRENDEVADRFLREHGEFKPGTLPKKLETGGGRITLLPGMYHTDGFFIAVFRKIVEDHHAH